MSINFAEEYSGRHRELLRYPTNIACRGMKLAYEQTFVQVCVETSYISIYSNARTRAFPISFALAEFLWIMSQRDDLESLQRFNAVMGKWSDDGIVLSGAYGPRIGDQISDGVIQRLKEDQYTRQACATIYRENDSFKYTKDMPCNIWMQFIIRNDHLYLRVVSRSSDFVTGYPIDSFHWQLLLTLVCNQLRKEAYPTLRVGDLTYEITSLHVYSGDGPHIERIATTEIYRHEFDYALQIFSTYKEVKELAIGSFHKCESLED